MIFKKTSRFLTTLFFILLFVAGFSAIPSRAAALLKVQSVKVTNSPVQSGQQPVLSVLLTNKGQVQYQAFLYSESTKNGMT